MNRPFPPKHSIRIIPRLDIKGPNLVKGIHLEGLRVLGAPCEFARYYCQAGADELMYQDVVASLYGRNSILELVRKTADESSIPLTVGGGVRTIDDICKLLRAGADKVAINTAAHARPKFITEAAESFGASTIVVAIEAIREASGEYYAFTDNGRQPAGRNVADWAAEVVSLGAGEIIITSVDHEGTGRGYDPELIRIISSAAKVPIVAHGGAGRSEDVVAAVRAGADAVCLASILHYAVAGALSVKSYGGEGNTDFLSRRGEFKKVGRATIQELRDALLAASIQCRIP